MTRSIRVVCGVSLSLLGLIGVGTASAQPSLLFYQNSQDQARSFDVDSLTGGSSVTGFLGALVGNARNIQADGDDDLLWYADTSGNIRSKVISTNTDGPSTVSSSILLGANNGADRHFSIDPADNTLYYSITDERVQIIDLDTMTSLGTIAGANFNGGIVGAFRHTTIDSVNRLMYYASTDNAFYSFDLDTLDPGPTVPSNLIAGAASGAFRHLIYDPNSGLIYYSVTDGSVHSVDPVTQLAGPTLASTNFTDNVGAGRIITMTYRVVPAPNTGLLRVAALAALVVLSRCRTSKYHDVEAGCQRDGDKTSKLRSGSMSEYGQ